LNEEGNADKKLSKIAEGSFLKSGINQQANTPQADHPKTPKKEGSKKTKHPAALK
jgi:hypothetical protein